jgi:hypothetical protein
MNIRIKINPDIHPLDRSINVLQAHNTEWARLPNPEKWRIWKNCNSGERYWQPGEFLPVGKPERTVVRDSFYPLPRTWFHGNPASSPNRPGL